MKRIAEHNRSRHVTMNEWVPVHEVHKICKTEVDNNIIWTVEKNDDAACGQNNDNESPTTLVDQSIIVHYLIFYNEYCLGYNERVFHSLLDYTCVQ